MENKYVSIYKYSLEDRVYVATSEKATEEILKVLADGFEIPVLEAILKNPIASSLIKNKVNKKLKDIQEEILKENLKNFNETGYSILYSTLRNKLKYLDSKNSKSELRIEITKNANDKKILNRILKGGNKNEILLAIENKIASDNFLINVLCSFKFKKDYDIKFAVIENSKVLLPLPFLIRFYKKENMKIEKNLELLKSIKNKIKQSENKGA